MDRLEEVLNRINPGRMIMMDKICPFINNKCIGSECNAFIVYQSTNIVDQKEIDDYIEQGNLDWQKEFKSSGWKLNTIIDLPKFSGLDQQTFVFTKVNEGVGNCLVQTKGCK